MPKKAHFPRVNKVRWRDTLHYYHRPTGIKLPSDYGSAEFAKAWAEAEGKRILGEMPTLQLGQGVVWIPGRGILQTAKFPKKRTFDSSRTPKRGETKRTLTLKPIDLGALKDKLAKVENEVAASDPKKLQAKVAELERQLRAGSASPELLAKVRDEGRREGFAEGKAEGHREGFQKGSSAGYTDGMGRAIEALTVLKKEAPEVAQRAPAPSVRPAPVARAAAAPAAPRTPRQPVAVDGLNGPQTRILASLMFWRAAGFDQPSNEQVAAVAGYAAGGGAFMNPRGALKQMGLIDYPRANLISLTAEGLDVAPAAPTGRVRDFVDGVLGGPEKRILDALPPDGSAVANDVLAAAAGYAAGGGAYMNPRGRLKTLGLITYLQGGYVAVEPWVFNELAAT